MVYFIAKPRMFLRLCQCYVMLCYVNANAQYYSITIKISFKSVRTKRSGLLRKGCFCPLALTMSMYGYFCVLNIKKSENIFYLQKH